MNEKKSLFSLYILNLKNNFVIRSVVLLLVFSAVLLVAKTNKLFSLPIEDEDHARLVMLSLTFLTTLTLGSLLKLSFFYTIGKINNIHFFSSFGTFFKSILMEWINVEVRVQLRVLFAPIITIIISVCLFVFFSPVGITEVFNEETELKAKLFAMLCIALPLIRALYENSRLSLSALNVFYNKKMKDLHFDPILESKRLITLKHWKIILVLISFDVFMFASSLLLESKIAFDSKADFFKALFFIAFFSSLSYLYYIFLHSLYVFNNRNENLKA